MRLARRYLISGRVQAVGFRYFTGAAAAREGIHGWVRNLPDGRVEIRAEGEAEALERFERSIAQGPPRAVVRDLDVTDEGADGRDTGFAIRGPEPEDYRWTS
jgi:acylphosphatase